MKSSQNLLKFDETFYLNKHRSVQSAVSIGLYTSGFHHFLAHGRDEGLEARFKEIEDPLVTVVVPCYNMSDFILHTLISISVQSYANFECIVVDDCSTDESAQIVSFVSKIDKRFKLVQHTANQGLSASRNTGLCHASGELVTFLDADDILFQNSLHHRVSKLLNSDDREVIGTFCGSVHIPEDFDSIPDSKSITEVGFADYLSNQGRCPFTANQPLMYTSLVKDMGGFDERLQQAEDWDFWNRVIRHGYEFVHTNFNAVGYRQRLGSMIRSAPLFHLETGLNIFNRFYEESMDRVNFATPTFYMKDFQHYAKQQVIADRVVAAIGMAGETDASAIEKCVTDYIPDIAAPALRKRLDIQDSLAKGIARAEGSKVSERNKIKVRDSVYLTRTEAEILKKSSSLIDSQKKTAAADRKQLLVFYFTKAKNISLASRVASCLKETPEFSQAYAVCFVLSESLRDRTSITASLDDAGIPAHSERALLLGLVKPSVFITDTAQDFGKNAAQAVLQSRGISVFWELNGATAKLPSDVFSIKLAANSTADATTGLMNALAGEVDKIENGTDQSKLYVKTFSGGKSVNSALAIVSFEENEREFRSEWIDAVNDVCLKASVEHRFWQSENDFSVIPPIKSIDGNLTEISGNYDLVICRGQSDLFQVCNLPSKIICFDPNNALNNDAVVQNASEFEQLLNNKGTIREETLLKLQSYEPLISEEAIARSLLQLLIPAGEFLDTTFLKILQESVVRTSAPELAQVTVTKPIEQTAKEEAFRILTRSPIDLDTKNGFALLFQEPLKPNKRGNAKSSFWKITHFIDRELEVFYHRTKNLPILGTLIRKLSQIYDSLFK